MRPFNSLTKKKRKLTPVTLLKTLAAPFRSFSAKEPAPEHTPTPPTYDSQHRGTQVGCCVHNQPRRDGESPARRRHLQGTGLAPAPHRAPQDKPDPGEPQLTPQAQDEPEATTGPTAISPAMFKGHKAKPLSFTPPRHKQEALDADDFDNHRDSWDTLHFSAQARADLERLSMNAEDIIDALVNDDLEEESILGAVTRFHSPTSEFYCRINLTQMIVIDIFTEDEHAETLRESSGARIEPQPGIPRHPGTKRNSRRHAPASMREFEERVAEFGFAFEDRGGPHRRLTHPDYPNKFITVPSTPSDNYRVWHNLCCNIRTVFQIDIRTYPKKK